VIEQQSQSPLYRTIEKRLKDCTLADLVAERRRFYPWAAIAREICAVADVEVSDQTLMRWFANDDEQGGPERAA
jgi:hypothetical protein